MGLTHPQSPVKTAATALMWTSMQSLCHKACCAVLAPAMLALRWQCPLPPKVPNGS